MRIFRNAFFSLKDTWTPTKIALGCIGLKIILSWILVRPLAHRGIALAESLSLITNAFFLFCFLPQELKGKEGWKTLAAFAQTLAGCVVMGTVVYFAQERLNGMFSLPLELVSLVLLGAAIYGATALLFQAEVSHSVLKTVTELGGKYSQRSCQNNMMHKSLPIADACASACYPRSPSGRSSDEVLFSRRVGDNL